MAAYSSYGTVEDTLAHIDRVVLDNGEFISAREVRAYIIQLRQEAAEQEKLLQQFADVGRAFEHADDLAQGFGRPQYDQARDRLAATYEGWRTSQQRRGNAS
ncbi:MAG: hypothetical protein H0X24_01775 [Ktedonobacterales bacterium]|nr:hypothetical protein [Ktedonobacterales bacterium]